MIKFDKLVAQAEFYSPLQDFALERQDIEYRVDPLLGLTSVVRTGRKLWASMTYQTDEGLIQRMLEESRGRCFFCPEKVTAATPKFLADLVPEGRMTRGEAVLFPNLFAQKEHSAIVVMTRSHYLPLGQFIPGQFADAFDLGLQYLRLVHERRGARYGEIGWNYLFPAGASIMHPHLQVLASDRGYYLMTRMEEQARAHYQEYGVNFWEELLAEEKKTGRYLGSVGGTEWFVPFAPTREDEVNAVVRGKSNFLDLDRNDLEHIAEGLCRVLRWYQSQGLSSVNFVIYSGPLGRRLDYLWAGLKIISRPSVQARAMNDVWYSALLLDGFVLEPPEAIAEMLRPYFSSPTPR